MPLASHEGLPSPRLTCAQLEGPHGPLRVLLDEGLRNAVGTVIAFTGRSGGVSSSPYDSLNLGDHVNDDLAAVHENRSALMQALGIPASEQTNLINPNQVHGSEVLTVGEDLTAVRVLSREGADGIVCARAGVPVLLCFADCVPVVIVAPGGAFAVAHAGWRGALAGIPGKALQRLCQEVDCRPAECNAYIGPHIGACCYETSQEILDRFVVAFGQGCDAGDRRLDLSFAVSTSLLTAGADRTRIVDANACTSCNNHDFFSYRADGGVTGRHGAFAYKEVN